MHGIDEHYREKFEGVGESFVTDEEKASLIRTYGEDHWMSSVGIIPDQVPTRPVAPTKIKFFVIEHRSDCSCQNCQAEIGYGCQLYFSDDAIIHGVESNPKPSKFSSTGSHEVKSVEAELDANREYLTVDFYGAKLQIPVEGDDLTNYIVVDHELCKIIGSIADREYTIRSSEVSKLLKKKGLGRYA